MIVYYERTANLYHEKQRESIIDYNRQSVKICHEFDYNRQVYNNRDYNRDQVIRSAYKL